MGGCRSGRIAGLVVGTRQGRGSVIGSIPGALIGGVARGVDSDGTYLWVSNPSNDKIYKLDMSTGLELDTWGAIKARF